MTPRFTFSKSVFRTISERARDARLVRRPSRVTLGVAAATALTAAGVAIAVSVTPGPASGSFSQLGAVARTGQAAAASHPGKLSLPVGVTSGGSKHPAAAPGTGTPASRSASKVRDTHHQAHAAPAKRTAHAGHAAARKPYLIYDSTTPTAIPAHHAIATYATGNYAASSSAVAGRKTVLWIDTTGSDPKASILDVEPGDATPSMAASWARARLTRFPHDLARIYTMRSEWPAVQAAIATLPAQMRSHIRYWIADPTGVPHLVPGSQATQWYWGSSYDISTATPAF